MQYTINMSQMVFSVKTEDARRFLLGRERKKKEAGEDCRRAILRKLKETGIWSRYPGIRCVYLFGSIVKNGSFHVSSDVDILIEGDTGTHFFSLWEDIEDMLEWETDLRETKKSSRLLQTARERGEIIYERKNTRP